MSNQSCSGGGALLALAGRRIDKEARAAGESRNASSTLAGFATNGSSGDAVPRCWSW
jgi:hypothetical protein